MDPMFTSSSIERLAARLGVESGSRRIGRTTLVRLTARGRDLQQRMAEVYASVVDAEVTGHFTEQEADVLVELSKRFDPPSPASTWNGRSKMLRRFNPEMHGSGARAELAE